MRRWIGLSIAAVALLHPAATFAIYPVGIAVAASYTLSGSIPPASIESEAFWFAMFAPFLFLFGVMVDRAERGGTSLGWLVVLVFSLSLVALIAPMPATGAWLLVPAGVGMWVRELRLARRV